MLKEKPMLADIIDLEYLQQLQDGIAKAANVSTIILDSLGNPITKLTNPRGICKLIGDLRDGPVCQSTHKALCDMAREARKPVTMACPISEMTGVSVPIFLEDVFLGAWIIGQVRFQGEPIESFVEAAQKTGLSPISARAAIEDIPVFSRSQFETIVDFMSIVTEEIIKLTASNIKINEKNVQFIELTKSLEHSMEALHAFADTPDVYMYMLHTLTGLITSALGEIWLQDEVASLDKMRESILNNINTIIYVSDLKTNKILFANTEIQRMYSVCSPTVAGADVPSLFSQASRNTASVGRPDFLPEQGGDTLIGRICWEALQNRNERCGFCPIPYLLKNPGKTYQWEFYNEVLGRRFRIQDSIIPWTGGKLAHLEYAVDISELRN